MSSSKYNGISNPLVGLLHMKIGKILLLNELCKDAINHFKKAQAIIHTTHGKQSTLHAELDALMLQTVF